MIQGGTVRYAWNGPYSKDVYNGVLDSLIPGVLGDDDSMNLYHFGITGACDYTKASQVLELLNDHREKNGLTPLTMDAELTEAAMQRAAEIAIYNRAHRLQLALRGKACHRLGRRGRCHRL